MPRNIFTENKFVDSSLCNVVLIIKKGETMEDSNNILWTCEHHGLDSYNLIKNTDHNYPGMVYVWFKDKTFGDEKMWVKITKGDRNEGVGTLSNIPIKFKHMDYGNIVKFKTNKKGITYGH